jgi:formylglycine-generating enzyme
MKTFCFSLLLSLLLASATFAQTSAVVVIITVSDNAGSSVQLHFGLDPGATDGIDGALGESEQPPVPPSGAFDARFIGDDIGISMGQGLLRDYRQGSNSTAGTRIHEIRYQPGSGTSIMISWGLPQGVQGRLQDIITGNVVDVTMSGTGQTTISNPGAIAKLQMTVTYSLGGLTAPTLSSPSNGATGVVTSPTLTWNSATGATSYRVQIATDVGFTSVVYDSSGIVGTSHQVQWLSGATKYWWRVYASNSGGSSGPSTAWSLTTLTGPYGGTRVVLPGTIEGENYDAGGEGSSYHDMDAENTGATYGCRFRTAEGVDIEPCQDPEGGLFNIAWAQPGEWTQYSVTVSKGGQYRMDARVATTWPGRFHLDLDGTNITGSVGYGNTGGWQVWATVHATVTLPQGDHTLRLTWDDTASSFYAGNINQLRFTSNDVEPSMVFVEGGPFQMGSTSGDADEQPVHTVTVSSFYLDPTEVTVAEYRAFCTATSRAMPTPPTGTWVDDHPIVNVSYIDAQAYANWANKRLPAEAEWEYAARGGKFNHSYVYSGGNSLAPLAWFVDNSGGVTHSIASRSANELGLYDMSGNVWEWCSDWYDANYYGVSPSSDPKGPAIGVGKHVNRGGSFKNVASACRVSDRTSFWYDSGLEDLGFRCARDYRPQAPVLLSPGNGANGVATSPQLSWSQSPGATSYQIQVSSDASFSSMVFDSSGVTGTSCRVGWLSGTTQYWWRVFAAGAGGQSDPSPSRTFSTLSGPYNGSRFVISNLSSTIDLACFDAGGEGVGYHDKEAENFGVAAASSKCRTAEGVDTGPSQDPQGALYSIGWTAPGEWLRYSITVISSGIYRMDARVATVIPGQFNLVLDQTNTISSVHYISTGGWATWATISDIVRLPAGDHTLDLVFGDTLSSGDDGNLNRIQFTWIRPPEVAVGEEQSIPTSYALAQNYPNPFNPSTTIRYMLPHRSMVSILAYNTLGQQVAALVNGDIDAGYHSVQFDGSGLPSGVYFYRMLARPLSESSPPGISSRGGADVFVETKKLLLVK